MQCYENVCVIMPDFSDKNGVTSFTCFCGEVSFSIDNLS
jgi:hypothetical protein